MVDSSWPPPPKENPSNKCPKNAGQIIPSSERIYLECVQDPGFYFPQPNVEPGKDT